MQDSYNNEPNVRVKILKKGKKEWEKVLRKNIENVL